MTSKRIASWLEVFSIVGKVPTGHVLAGLGFVAFWTTCVAAFSPPIENLVRDVMTTTISPFKGSPPDIVVVAITEQTLEKFPYRSPVDRAFLADLVQRIDEARPRAIGIDLLFDQPTETDKDRHLAAVIEGAENPVVVASGSREDDLTEKQLTYLDRFAPNAIRGLVALSHDRVDGVVREAFPGRASRNGWQSGFASALAEAAGVPPPRKSEKMVYYRSAGISPGKFLTYPAHAVEFAPPAWFAGKFVLIGVDLPLQDRHLTPFAVLNGAVLGALPGVIVHAHALARLIEGDRIVEPVSAVAIVPFVLATALCVWIAWRPMPVVIKPLAILGTVVVVLIAEIIAFAWHGIMLPMIAPSMMLIGLSGFVAFLAWLRDSKERRFIQSAFSQYLSPAVVAEIVKEPASLRLGGSERLVTCVFTDLEGFTGFSERTDPKAFASVLNEYLEAMCGLFIEHGATIDKLIGDAVVGFFGAPGAQDDQTGSAIELTLAIGALSRRFQTELRGRGQEIGATRTGVHRGPALVGNFGGNRFFNYTAMGDTVNTAARLEGANKYLGTLNCVSEEVSKFAVGHLLRPSGLLRLAGKAEFIRAFEVMDDTDTNRELVKLYSEAYLWMSEDDTRAASAFESLVRQFPDDGLIAFHLRRLTEGQQGDKVYLEGK